LIRYYLWAVGEKFLSYAPGGRLLYRRVGEAVKGGTQGCGTQFLDSLPTARKVSELLPSGVVMEVGTGWFHHDAFLLYLVGDYEIVLFDVADKSTIVYIHNYIGTLLKNAELLSSELRVRVEDIHRKLAPLLQLSSREAIYERCRFKLLIDPDPTRTTMASQSVDAIVSNCTLVHIRPKILKPELRVLRDVLKDNGFMYHHLGHDDHWAFHDPAVSWPSFNYLRYSDRVWSCGFETRLEYHNRMVKPEWIEMFNASGLIVEEYGMYVTDESRAAVARLPRVDARFSRYSREDLAAIYSYVLLRKGSSIPATQDVSAIPTPLVSPLSVNQSGSARL
jgi:hypothetical protein